MTSQLRFTKSEPKCAAEVFYAATLKSSSTSRTPGADHAARSASFRSAQLPDVDTQEHIDLVLLCNRYSQNLFDVMASLKATCPHSRIIVTGSGMDEVTILKAIASGAKGYVDATASAADFVQAIRIVSQGSVWAPRRVLSMFIERASSAPSRIFPAGRVTFTDREKEVLEMLVAARSNKEIGATLGIEERTVKAHVAKLLRKVGVQNRIALSVHAVTHSLVSPPSNADPHAETQG